MKFLLGTKEKMSQIFHEDGTVTPVTIVKTGPITVTQVKTLEQDGYDALQFGYGVKAKKNISQPLLGHMKGQTFRYLKEEKASDEAGLSVGDTLTPDVFAEGDKVTVSSVSKGKGFQGVVKRHGFKGGRRSHGQKHSEREPGSIGSTGPQRVFKGTRMAGRMGSDRVTVKNLKVAGVDLEKGEILITGAVPGRTGTLVEIRG